MEQEIDRKELVKAIDTFLSVLSAEKRGIFVRRYWYFDNVPEIASRFGMTENNVSVTLNRIRLANNNGRYCFNPELNVRIDVQEFQKLEALLAVLPTEDAIQKTLEDMVAMYKGSIILTKNSPRWMVTNRHHMQNHYLKAVNRLLNIYFKKNDFSSLHEYAARSMRIIPNNVVGYYWKLRSYRKLGIVENEDSLLENAKLCLPEDIFERLKSRIDRMDDENPDEIYEADYYI